MFLSITSELKKFSYLLNKNPASPPKIKTIRKGYGVGFFSGEENETYNLHFVEGHDEISFGSGDFEYLDTNKFCNPFIFHRLIELVIGKVKEEYDEEAEFTVEISSLFLPDIEGTLKELTEVFGFQVGLASDHSLTYHQLILSKVDRLSNILDALQVFSVQLASRDSGFFIDEGMIEKTLGQVAKLDLPYKYRYKIKGPLLKNSKDLFDKYGALLNQSSLQNLQMTYGSREENLLSFIRTQVKSIRAKRANQAITLIDLYSPDDKLAYKTKDYVDKTVVVPREIDPTLKTDGIIYAEDMLPHIIPNSHVILIGNGTIEYMADTDTRVNLKSIHFYDEATSLLIVEHNGADEAKRDEILDSVGIEFSKTPLGDIVDGRAQMTAYTRIV